MAFIPTAGAVRVDIQFVQAGQQIHNVIWCIRDAPWTQAQREALNLAIKDWWDTTAKVYFSSQLALTQVTSVNQDSSSSPSSTLVVSPAISGTAASEPLPNGSAMVASLRTDLRGRNYRGRMYLAGVRDSSRVDAISIATTEIANLISALAALKTVIDGLGAIWVVVSHFLNKLPRTAGLKTPITAISMDQYIDSQRRRLGLRGV